MNRIYKKYIIALLTVLLSSCFHESEISTRDKELIEIPDTGVSHKVDILRKTENCSDFKTYLAQNLIEQYLDNQRRGWGFCPFCLDRAVGIGGFDDFNEAVPTAGTVASDQGAADPGSVTGTNNQEADVDELDTIKTDSSGNLYLTENKTLYIIDAFPPESMKQLASLDIGEDIIGLFLDEDNQRLVIITREWDEKVYQDAAIAYPYYYSLPKTKIFFIDIAQLDSPQITRLLELDGSYTSARFINNRLHLVLDHQLQNIDESFATKKFLEDLDKYWKAKSLDLKSIQEEIAEIRADLAGQIVEGINSLDINMVLPAIQIDIDEQQLLLQCSDVYHPEVSIKTGGLISVNSIDSDGENLASVGAFASGGQVYATLDAMYVMQMSSGWWWSFDDEKTVIHKFDLGDTETKYTASGMVAGLIKDQFSLSEFNNYLRVATSERAWPDNAVRSEQYNHLFILKENNAILEVTGSVEKFAPDERIFSVRYLENRGFVVTFRNTDPLFAFDLSDPENPQITGELEIPGFSTYMHPIDENHLLTIGQAGDEQGATGDLQLQLFDVSDMENPTRIAAHIPQMIQDNTGWGYSIAQSDHHAFTYAAEDKVLAIPLSYYNWKNSESFAGIATFKIDISEGITENGSVDHSDFIDVKECGKSIDNLGVVYDESCINNYYSWQAQPNRSVIMRDSDGLNSYLYSVSRLGVKVNDLASMSDALNAVSLQE